MKQIESNEVVLIKFLVNITFSSILNLKDIEFEDETLIERIVALTEMFPEPVRDFTCSVFENTTSLSKTLFSLSKSGIWVLATSFTILIFPIIVEQERTTIEEQQTMQQRQLLLGPSAASSSASSPSSIPFGYGMPSK
jgi:mitochondrial import receptor subunit TOM22